MAKAKWAIDKVHSEIGFTVRHMMISKVKGVFHEYDGTIIADPSDLTTAEVEFSVDLNSIDTRNSDRDNHLRSADFFDVENHPKMTFKGTKISKVGENKYEVTGNLTIRGVTRPETFTVEVEGVAKDPFSGVEKTGFSVTGTINRKNYGLEWNAALETGGVLVGEEVNVQIEIEAQKVE